VRRREAAGNRSQRWRRSSGGSATAGTVQGGGGATRSRLGQRAQAQALPFIEARAQGLPWRGGQGEPAAAYCHGSSWPMGLGGPVGWAGAGRVGPERVGSSGSDRSSRIGFSFFRIYF
jgi:hypothetical protein